MWPYCRPRFHPSFAMRVISKSSWTAGAQVKTLHWKPSVTDVTLHQNGLKILSQCFITKRLDVTFLLWSSEQIGIFSAHLTLWRKIFCSTSESLQALVALQKLNIDQCCKWCERRIKGSVISVFHHSQKLYFDTEKSRVRDVVRSKTISVDLRSLAVVWGVPPSVSPTSLSTGKTFSRYMTRHFIFGLIL